MLFQKNVWNVFAIGKIIKAEVLSHECHTLFIVFILHFCVVIEPGDMAYQVDSYSVEESER